MSEEKNIFQVKANDESLQSKSSGVFGLNTGKISKFEFNDKAGKDGTDADAIDITVDIDGKEYYNRFFLGEEVFGNGSLLKKGDEGYDKAFYAHYGQIVAVVKHALGVLGVEEAAMNAVLSELGNNDLVNGMKKLLTLVPNGFKDKSIDIFLEYQWKISTGQDRTFLTLPKNMKGGIFLCPHVAPEGKWKAVTDDGKLHYIDNGGKKHPFTRDAKFMGDKKAHQQGAGSDISSDIAADNAGNASESSWS